MMNKRCYFCRFASGAAYTVLIEVSVDDSSTEE